MATFIFVACATNMFLMSFDSNFLECIKKAFKKLPSITGFKEIAKLIHVESFAIGAIVVLAIAFAQSTPKLAWISALMVMLTMCYLLHRWLLTGTKLAQFLIFAAVELLMMFWLSATIQPMMGTSSFELWRRVPFFVTELILVGAAIHTMYGIYDKTKEKKYVFGIAIVAGLFIFSLIRRTPATFAAIGKSFGAAATSAVRAVDDATTVKAEETATTVAAPAAEAKWYSFGNTTLQSDKDPDNDFNFGPNPIEKGLTAKDYDEIFRQVLRKDPARGAADMAWFDAMMGTRYLGEFYDSCKGDWAKTINKAKETWKKDQASYDKTLDAFFKYLNKGIAGVETRTSGLVDQMYMNPYTVDGVPDVIVMKTLNHEGTFLVYTFKIKGVTTTNGANGAAKTIAVAYRIDCGFQPVNVEKVMNIKPSPTPVNPNPTPTPKPTPKPTSGPKPTPTPTPGPKPTPTPTPGPTPTPTPAPTPTPTPVPTPTPKPTKDPTQSNNSGNNSNSGTGRDTNTGIGGNKSSEESEISSTDRKAYEEAQQHIREADAADQREAGDSTAPSTIAPGADVVENTGAQEIEKPAGNADTQTVDGKELPNNPSNPEGSWGDPVD